MLENIGKNAKKAKLFLRTADGEKKTRALLAIADAIQNNVFLILQNNAKDIEAFRKSEKYTDSMCDRLTLGEDRIKGLVDAVREIARMEDPIGQVSEGTLRPNGLFIEKVSVPLGVVAVIYESRPNVTVDTAALCLKSSNACILRGGKEAFNTNVCLADIMRGALDECGFPEDCIQIVRSTDRAAANELMTMTDCVDVLIPRGGAGLIRSCVENARVPVIQTGTGNCHVYVDEYADLDTAFEIIKNGKLSRPSVCNAVESLLINKKAVSGILPRLEELFDRTGVKVHADDICLPYFKNGVIATDEDYGTEYLGLEISVKAVDDVDEAIDHIEKYSTGHSECIVTKSYENSRKFLAGVDSAAVYVNASTRFTDGGEFGFGAEIGISTQKLHARGPLGLRHLTSYKYRIYGDGQTR